MRIAIYNPATMAFNVATPEEQPLGGMASCMCYLARALASRGHQVTLISILPPGTPQMLMGVEHQSTLPVLPDAINFFRAKDYDAVIAVNYPDIASYIAMGSPKSFNVAWFHIYPDQPALAPLDATQGWLDAAVCVSATLRDAFRLRIPVVAIDNAIAPFFENMFSSAAELLAAKKNRAAYASMPFRGLDLMVEVMGRIGGKVELDVFSSMRSFQAQERFTQLYEMAARNPRIRYHGGVGQKALAAGLRACAFLAYPSTYIESYCIVAQEALAAGLKVISNDLGALPETTMGYADLLPVKGLTIPREDHIAGITRLLETNEADFLRSPEGWAEQRFEQAQHISRESTWARRAMEWEAFLAPAVAAKRAPR